MRVGGAPAGQSEKQVVEYLQASHAGRRMSAFVLQAVCKIPESFARRSACARNFGSMALCRPVVVASLEDSTVGPNTRSPCGHAAVTIGVVPILTGVIVGAAQDQSRRFPETPVAVAATLSPSAMCSCPYCGHCTAAVTSQPLLCRKPAAVSADPPPWLQSVPRRCVFYALVVPRPLPSSSSRDYCCLH